MRYLTIEQRESLQRQLSDRAAALRDEIAELERDVRELREVDAALGRLHTPDFGVCTDCGSVIPYSRLSAEPSATRCLSCQKKAERSTETVAAEG